MKKVLYIWIMLLASLSLHSQTNPKAKACTSYTQQGRKIVFSCDDGTKLSMDILSSSVVKIWFDPAGTFVRGNESFAVVNEELEKMEEIHVS